MKIALAADHAGFEYKNKVVDFLKPKGIEVKDFGTNSTDSVDYPDFIHPLATAVENKEHDLGIIFCGSANGVAITANKHQGIRAVIAWEVEIAKLGRQHNDANVLAIPARFISEELALQIIEAFISTDFEGGRHQDRVNKIACSCK